MEQSPYWEATFCYLCYLYLNILLSTLLSSTLNLCSSLNPYKGTGKIIFLIFSFLVRTREYNLNWMVGRTHRIKSVLNSFVNVILIYYCFSQRFEFCHTLEGFSSYLCIMILPCILVTICEHMRSNVSNYKNHLLKTNVHLYSITLVYILGQLSL
jgi:hypothetical protein